MTEAEWQSCTDPQLMLEFLRGKTSDRKLRLFAVACCREIWPVLADYSRTAIEVTESYADGRATQVEMDEASLNAFADYEIDLVRHRPEIGPVGCTTYYTTRTAPVFHQDGTQLPYRPAHESVVPVLKSAQECHVRSDQLASLFRCIFDSAWLQPTTIHTTWRTSSVVRLTEAIYEERAFDRMPILGDALEEAGCENAEILAHCRSGDEHVRGCWVVDLVLAKE